MAEETESDKLTRQMTWYGIKYNTVIAIGAAFFASGIAAFFAEATLIPTLFSGDSKASSVIVLLSYFFYLLLGAGGFMIGVSLYGAHRAIKSKKINHPRSSGGKNFENKLRNITAGDWGTILIGIGTIVIGIVALSLQGTDSMILREQTEIQKQQELFENYTFNNAHFPILISVVGANIEPIKADSYTNFPITATLSFSTVSPDYLEFIITNPRLALGMPCTFSSNPQLYVNQSAIVKFVDKGVSNENFVIPLLLNYHPKYIPSDKLSGEMLLSTPVYFNVTAIDVQNKTHPVVWRDMGNVYAELHITNQSLAKEPC